MAMSPKKAPKSKAPPPAPESLADGMKWELLEARRALHHRLLGATRNQREWIDNEGTARLIREKLEASPPVTNAVPLSDVLGTPDHVPEGCVLTDNEALSIPLHLSDGSVIDVRRMFKSGAQLRTVLRNRRDYEAVVLATAAERGTSKVPTRKQALYDALYRAVRGALEESP